jgi:hypothetical protein
MHADCHHCHNANDAGDEVEVTFHRKSSFPISVDLECFCSTGDLADGSVSLAAKYA